MRSFGKRKVNIHKSGRVFFGKTYFLPLTRELLLSEQIR